MFVKFATHVLAVASIAASSIPVARQASNTVTCIRVLDPQSAVPVGTSLKAKFNFQVSCDDILLDHREPTEVDVFTNTVVSTYISFEVLRLGREKQLLVSHGENLPRKPCEVIRQVRELIDNLFFVVHRYTQLSLDREDAWLVRPLQLRTQMESKMQY
ncbi:hypothetical protein HYPSUDRAFT_60209 [Hypholoma sublateritium FD-334 SS-4]|uniref:Uncharacterized protein n=1 Tax=Hypholoma sublateritium (strain FD-334 SS-4) TaxID=945553 RepID=A0A0D2LPW2_HYPSF|nr:hypothetical protein HYPSUDRAFT_60209 [Hypholoma sublateritium FD-334 SS-4]